MEKTKKPFYKQWWFWLIAFLFLLVMGNANTQKPVEITAVPETVQEENDPIQTAIDNQHFAYSDLKISNNDGNIKISLHYDKESWDETSFCNSCLTDYINICTELYAIEGINNIDYSVFVDLIDTKGNTSSQKGFQISMPKNKFSTYTWENLKFIPGSYEQIEADSEIYIYPGIKQNVDFNKMYYKG